MRSLRNLPKRTVSSTRSNCELQSSTLHKGLISSAMQPELFYDLFLYIIMY
jgi:hypothetical protein